MKNALFLILITLVFNNLNSQNNSNCLEVLESNSGIESFYSDQLNQLACDLKNLVDEEVTLVRSSTSSTSDFKVFGCDFYPILAFTEETQGQKYEELFDQAITQLDGDHDSYFIITTEVYKTGGSVNSRIHFKLPDIAPFNEITIYEKSAINRIVKEVIDSVAISNNYDLTTNSKNKEAGVLSFINILNQMVDGTFAIDEDFAMESNGFDIFSLGTNQLTILPPTDTCAMPTRNLEYAAQVLDYSCTNYNNISLVDNASTALSSHPNTLVILTSSRMDDYQNRDNEADAFVRNPQNDNTKHALRIHLKFDGNILKKIYFKAKSFNTVEEDKIETDTDFEQHMEAYRDFTPEEPQSGPYACGTSDSNCSPGISYEEIKKWRAYCCLKDDVGGLNARFSSIFQNFPPIEVGGKGVLDYQAGVALGVMDGLLETIFFLYDTGKGLEKARSHTIFTVDWFTETYQLARKKGSLVNAVSTKIGEDYKYWKDLYDTAKSLWINRYEIIDVIGNTIKAFLQNLDPRSGLLTSGYSSGKILFEVILGVLSGGGKTYASIAKTSGEFLSMVSRIGKNPQGLLQDIGRMATTSTDRITLALCQRGIIRNCFLPSTPVYLDEQERTLISEIKVGQLVLANTEVNATQNLWAGKENVLPLLLSEVSVNQKGIASSHYKIVLEDLTGLGSKATLIRTASWMKREQIKVGEEIYVNLEQKNLQRYMKVTKIEKFFLESSKDNRNVNDFYELYPVTGIFVNHAKNVWQLAFENGDTLGVTAEHPIYSLTNQGWALAGDIMLGEEVMTHKGSAILESKERVLGEHKVYNLEVEGVHNFLVGEEGLVVHNANYGLDDLPRYAELEFFLPQAKKVHERVNLPLENPNRIDFSRPPYDQASPVLVPIKAMSPEKFDDAIAAVSSHNTVVLSLLAAWATLDQAGRDEIKGNHCVQDLFSRLVLYPDFQEALLNELTDGELFNFCRDFVLADEEVYDLFEEKPGMVNMWKLLYGLPENKIWVRKNVKLLEKMEVEDEIIQNFVNLFYTTFRPLNLPSLLPTIVSGITFNEYGFPDFRSSAPNMPDGLRCVFNAADHPNGFLSGEENDLIEANNWALAKYGSSNFKKLPNRQCEIKQNGQWIKYTWHHFEDGRNMFPVPHTIHSSVIHTGGASVIDKNLEDFFDPLSF